MKEPVRFRGFEPLNPYVWEYFAHRPLDRLEVLLLHAKFIPSRLRTAWFYWRLDRKR
jgi:hypothetical protein